MSDLDAQGMNDGENGQAAYEEPDLTGYVPRKYKGEKKPFTSVLICFFVMLAFLGIQFAVMLPIMMVKTIKIAKTVEKIDESIYKTLLESIDKIGLTLIATVVSMVVAVVWYRLAYCRGFGLKSLKKKCTEIFKVRTVGGIILGGISAYYMCGLLIMLLEVAFPSLIEDYNELMEASGFTEVDWIVIVLTVFMAPINEECIMRGIIFSNLKKNMAPKYAIVISAILFGVFHMNIVQGLYATAIGLLMAYYAYKYDSIIASMLLHAVFNGFNFFLLLFPEEIQTSTILSFVIPIVTAIAWYFVEGKNKIKDIN